MRFTLLIRVPTPAKLLCPLMVFGAMVGACWPSGFAADSASVQSWPLVRAPSQVTEPLFEELPASRTGIDFEWKLPDPQKHIHELIHLSVYGGVCAGDYDGDRLPDLFVTRPAGGSRLFRNLGDFRFEDVTAASGLSDADFWATGATFVDINNDGRLDLYVCGYNAANRLYVNLGKGAEGRVQFAEQAKRFGLDYQGASMMMAFADMDNDGDLDGYLATTAIPPPPNLKFRVSYENGRPVVPKELEEYWALLYLPGGKVHRTEAGQFDRLYRNDGERFADVTKSAGIQGAFFTLGAIWWDYNADGKPDVYVANDYLGPDILYRNNGDGTFTDVIRQVLPHTPWSSMGMDIADLNGDGRVDLLATDMLGSTHYRRNVMVSAMGDTTWFLEFAEPRQYARNALYLNTGAERMMEAAYLAGLAATDWTWGPRLEDFDNDGRVDVFIANGMLRDVQNADLARYADRVLGGGSPPWAKFWAEQPMLKETNFVFRNLGDLRFENVTAKWGLNRVGVSLGTATADLDGDGSLDLIVNNADAPLSLYRNRSAGNVARVQLRGTRSNRFGIGATVRLQAGGVEQVRYLTLARGWLSASEPVAHFGLGPSASIDSLVVEWPSGSQQRFANLRANQFYVISEPEKKAPAHGPESGGSVAAETPSRVGATAKPLFVEAPLLQKVRLRDTPYDDFAREPLLPRRISQRDFCLAWGDVDGDGDADLFVGGRTGSPSSLYLQEAGGRFELAKMPALEGSTDSDDAAALFFDANDDGRLDLYVVTGGVRHETNHVAFRDRLYFNDRRGRLELAPEGTLPDLRDSGSCIAAADVNRDGAIDLFVGGYSIPGKYPLAASSRLLLNRAGRFMEETPSGLGEIGLVTAAVWADANGDGWSDLFVATEWGPVTYFRNEAGKLADATQQAGLDLRTGWWSAIASGDLDRDGDVDFVVGNVGLNSRYRAELEKPEMLFYGDLDDSRTAHLLEAQFMGELGYPHRTLPALARAMPGLQAKFQTFHQFALAPIEQITTMEHLRRARRFEANTLESGVFINDGKGRFEFKPLPRLAQIAPVRDLALADFNGDGTLDVIIAQNDFSPNPDTGRMDGGVSLLLLGNGKGDFEVVSPDRSGIVVAGEAKRVSLADVNRDGIADVVFGTGGGELRVFVSSGEVQRK